MDSWHRPPEEMGTIMTWTQYMNRNVLEGCGPGTGSRTSSVWTIAWYGQLSQQDRSHAVYLYTLTLGRETGGIYGGS